MSYDELTNNELIERAEQLEESGEFEEALDFWRAAAIREPDAVTLCQLGALATQLGNWEEAEKALVQASSLAPELPNPHGLLGFLYLERAEPYQAIEQLQKAVDLGSNAARLTALGVAQFDVGNVEEARRNLSGALAIDPDYEEAAYNLGLTFRDQEPAKGAELFEKALAVDREYSDAHRELGWVRHKLNDEAEAEYHLRRAIELDETDAWAHIYLGNILWTRRDLQAAEQQFKRALDLWPDSSVPYWCLAIFFEYEGREEEAREFFQKALNVDPDDPQANKLFGVYLKEMGETVKAKAYLERAHEIDPDDQTISALLATLS